VKNCPRTITFIERGTDLVRTLLPALWAVTALAWAAGAQGVAEPDPAEELFRAAFAADLDAEQQCQALERIVKEYPGSKWGDDALWVLGEQARRAGDGARMVRYWQLMLVLSREPALEGYTRERPVFRRSRMPVLEHLLQAEGVLVDRGRGPVVHLDTGKPAEVFNPLPLVVWSEVAAYYEGIGSWERALAAYRAAHRAAPGRGRWRPRLEESIARLVPLVKARQNAPGPGGPEDCGTDEAPEKAGDGDAD
jgi:hypothetical protein